MSLADEIKEAIDRAVARAMSNVEIRAGTIVLSPSYMPGDPLTVVLDGSARAIEVKMIRAFNVFPEARVVCARVGVDWTALGVYIDPSQGNIVAGVPGGARFEFDPDQVRARVYDVDGDVVIEMDDVDGIKAQGDQIAGSCNSLNNNAMTSGTDTTTSGSYVNMAGTGSVTSFSFTKRYTATRVQIIMNLSAYATTAAADGMMGVNINGTDYDMMEEAFLLNNRLPYSSVRHISGVPAGVHTVQARWRRTSASGTLTRDPACWISISAQETN